MKSIITATAIAIALTATSASAFNVNNRNTEANARATAVAGASASAHQSQGQIQGQSQGIYGNNTGASVNIQDRKQAPGVAAPSFSSGHPCGIAPASLGISFIGGAITGGGQVSDDACLLAQMGYTDAAMSMIASRNADAYKALMSTGHIAPAPASAVVATRDVRPQARAVAYTSCNRREDGALLVGFAPGASDAAKQRGISECKAALR